MLDLSLPLNSPNMLDRVFHHFLGFLLDGRIGLLQERLIHLLHEGVKQHLPLFAVKNIP